MASAILNGATHAPSPTAHLQIKYVSRMCLPDTRTSSPFFSSLRARATTLESTTMKATITDNATASSWRVSVTVRNASSAAQSKSIKVYSWPMFEPENSQFIASASTSAPVQSAQDGKIEVEVPKRDLAVFNERTGKWVLEEGIYMFEIKSTEDLSAGMGVMKQVSVGGKMQWDE